MWTISETNTIREENSAQGRVLFLLTGKIGRRSPVPLSTEMDRRSEMTPSLSTLTDAWCPLFRAINAHLLRPTKATEHELRQEATNFNCLLGGDLNSLLSLLRLAHADEKRCHTETKKELEQAQMEIRQLAHGLPSQESSQMPSPVLTACSLPPLSSGSQAESYRRMRGE